MLALGEEPYVQKAHHGGDTQQDDHRHQQNGNDTAPAFRGSCGTGLVGIPIPGLYIVVTIIHKETSLRSDELGFVVLAHEMQKAKCRMQNKN
jgi:hypothetical protein